jgi:hypothetical protein
VQEKKGGSEDGTDFARYQYFFNRFSHQHDALMFAQSTRSKGIRTMSKLQALEGSSGDMLQVQFVLDAIDVVIACRSVIAWSYCWQFYLDAKAKLKPLFKNHMESLETYCDQLHEMVELEPEKLQDDLRRAECVNLTTVLHKYRKSIVAFCQTSNGLGTPTSSSDSKEEKKEEKKQ